MRALTRSDALAATHPHGGPYDLCPLMPCAMLRDRAAISYFNNTAALLFHPPFRFLFGNPAVKHAPLSETLPRATRELFHSISPLSPFLSPSFCALAVSLPRGRAA